MSHLMSRLAQRGAGLRVAYALADATFMFPTTPAQASHAPITLDEQDYYPYYHLGQLHASGCTGKDMTTSLLDGPANTSIPKLQGTNTQCMSRCDAEPSEDNQEHGTVIAQTVLAPEFGVVLEARPNRYMVSLKGDTSSRDCAIGWWDHGYSETSVPIELAFNDEVGAIMMSSTYSVDTESMRWVLARAITQKISVVALLGNESKYNLSTLLMRMTSVMGASSMNPDGSLTSYSDYGDFVSAASVPRPYARSGIAWGTRCWQGTSFVSSTVTPLLALVEQNRPEATGNQLLRALVHTGVDGNGGYWNPYTGYGAVDPYMLLTTNPTQSPDGSPFMNRGYEPIPTRQNIAGYADGLVDPRRINVDDSYQYRGFDEHLILSREHGYSTYLGTSPRFHVSNTSNTKRK